MWEGKVQGTMRHAYYAIKRKVMRLGCLFGHHFYKWNGCRWCGAKR